MATAALSQSEIDGLLQSIATPGNAGHNDVVEFDFRRPDKFPADLINHLEELHRGFASLVTTRFSRELRTAVHVEVVAAEQMTYDSYVRSMPNPNLLFVLDLQPLPGRAVLELSPQLGFILVDLMLGGPGRPMPVRRPTELETLLLGQLITHPLAALESAFETILPIEPKMVATEFNPQFAHAAPPAEMMLLITLALNIPGPEPTRALMGIAYPFSTLEPAAALLRKHKWSQGLAGEDTGAEADGHALTKLREVNLELSAQLRPSKITAADLAGLQPGDVIRLDHWAEDTVLGMVGKHRVLEGFIGKQGDHVALQTTQWKVDKQ